MELAIAGVLVVVVLGGVTVSVRRRRAAAARDRLNPTNGDGDAMIRRQLERQRSYTGDLRQKPRRPRTPSH